MRDVTELLHDAAPLAPGGPDLEGIEVSVSRRRAGRVTSLALSIVVATALAGTMLPDRGEPAPVIHDGPSPVETTSDEPDDRPHVLSFDDRLIDPGPVMVDFQGTWGLTTGTGLVMDAPEGWQGYLGNAIINATRMVGSDSDWRQVAVWSVIGVPPDVCRWDEDIPGQAHRVIEVGPTVADFASALHQVRPESTVPEPVTLAGHDGLVMDISLPVDFRIGDCDREDGAARAFAFYIEDMRMGRYHQAPGQVHRLWILDVGGQRLVIDANWTHNALPEQVQEVLDIVDSIRFEPFGPGST